MPLPASDRLAPRKARGDGGPARLVRPLPAADRSAGSPDPEETAVQLGCYALYARDVLDVPPDRVDLLEVNLREGPVSVPPWDDQRVDAMRERLRLSIRAMKAWLRNPDANAAAPEDFEPTEELR